MADSKQISVEFNKSFCQGLEYPLKSFFQLELISPDKTSISDPIPDLEPEPELAPAPEPAQVYDVGSAVDAGLVCSVDLPPPEPLVDPNSEARNHIIPPSSPFSGKISFRNRNKLIWQKEFRFISDVHELKISLFS